MSSDKQARQGARKRLPLWAWFAISNGLGVVGIAIVLVIIWQRDVGRSNSSAPAKNGAATPVGQTVNSQLTPPQQVRSNAIGGKVTNSEPAPAQAMSVGEVIDHVAPGVVLISCLDSKGKEYGFGSGFVIDGSGLVATSFHVIRRAWNAKATFPDGTKTGFVGCRAWDSDGDLAILQLTKMPLGGKPLAISTDQSPRHAAEVIAIGHPQGFKFTTTTGIISGVHKTKELPKPYATEIHAPAENLWIQTNAAISSGNSGGPLLNMTGEVIGINTWVATGQNLGFAVAVRHLRALRHQLKPNAVSLAELTGPEEQLETMIAEFSTQYAYLLEQAGKAWTKAAAKQLIESQHPALDFLPKFYQFADQQRGKPSALYAMQAIFQVAALPDVPKTCNPTLKSAADRLTADYRNDERLVPLVTGLIASPLSESTALCRRIGDESENHRVQGFALYSFAANLQVHADPQAPPNSEMIAVFERIAKDFHDVEVGETDLASLADRTLFDIKNLAVGRTAQNIVGKDADDVELKLSDYRGKVVVLDFWVDWCPHCVAMYPVERALVSKYVGKPFAILGVNCDEAARLKRVLDAKTVTWRNWADGPAGPISAHWHVDGFPTLFVLDQNGVIRYRNVRGYDLENAVAELMTKASVTKPDEQAKLPADAAPKSSVNSPTADAPTPNKAPVVDASLPPKSARLDPSELRNWTRTDGREAQLRFVGVEGEKVRLKRPDGREVLVSLAELSQPDQDWVRGHAAK
jgi:S1-C subfamily serine protease/thiol-disulfide isomerase/thioredoxin